MITMFDGDDKAYQQWLSHNLRGYVVNMRRRLSPSYAVLHGAWCPYISIYTRMARHGGFTERNYIKVCALEADELRAWLRSHGRPDGSFSKECSRCMKLPR